MRRADGPRQPFAPPPGRRIIREIVRNIERAGRRPVLLAAQASQLRPYGSRVRKVMALKTTMDASILMGPPRTTGPLRLSVWMWEPSS